MLEALKVSWMKRKTTASAVGEWECVKATGRRDIETQTLWSPNGGYNSRVAKLILDGRKQEVQTPTGELVMANAEWEDDTIVVYFQGKQGLEMRRYMREDPIGKQEMCVAWRIPTSRGRWSGSACSKRRWTGCRMIPSTRRRRLGEGRGQFEDSVR